MVSKENKSDTLQSSASPMKISCYILFAIESKLRYRNN